MQNKYKESEFFMKKAKKVMMIILIFLYFIAGTAILMWNYISGAEGLPLLSLQILAISGIVVGALSVLDSKNSKGKS